jgi:cyclopropane fatty-acyl-phospholipid synthase-like methyltransferase
VWGVDVVPAAIQKARDKTRARGLAARFEVGNALVIESLGRRFDTLIDAGLFHMFGDEDRQRFVKSLERGLVLGGTCHIRCFREPILGAVGPRPVHPEELRAAFSQGWTFQLLREAHFQMRPPLPLPRAWLASLRYTP